MPRCRSQSRISNNGNFMCHLCKKKAFQESALTLLQFSNWDICFPAMYNARASLGASQRKGFLHTVEAGDLYKTCCQAVQQSLAEKEAVSSTFSMSNILKAGQPCKHTALASRDSKSCKGITWKVMKTKCNKQPNCTPLSNYGNNV